MKPACDSSLAKLMQAHGSMVGGQLLESVATLEEDALTVGSPEVTTVPPAADGRQREIDSLRRHLETVLRSKGWRLARHLRQTRHSLQQLRHEHEDRRPAPELSVIITCHDQGIALEEAVRSVREQAGPQDEILVVNCASTDPITLHVLDDCRISGCTVLQARSPSLTAGRNFGARQATGVLVCAIGAEHTLEPGFIARAKELLSSRPELRFVSGGLRDVSAAGFIWAPASADLPGVLGCWRAAAPLVRSSAFAEVRGYDGTLSAEYADWDLVIRLIQHGEGVFLEGASVTEHPARRSPSKAPAKSSLERLFFKHQATFEAHAPAVLWGHRAQGRRLRATVWDLQEPLPGQGSRPQINWGNLRRVEPLSRVWGLDRGPVIDRYYIERFLEEHRGDIHGTVLEVLDATYTRRYGHDLEHLEVVDIETSNPAATLVADLSAVGSLPASTYDCAIVTQTIHVIADVRAVVANLAQAMKSGGTVLATLPCVSRVDFVSGIEGDYWRFTAASARWLFEAEFGSGNVTVVTAGNALSTMSSFLGASADELSPAELDHHDPYFPMLVCVRAVKPHVEAVQGDPAPRSAVKRAPTPGAAVILMYHRIAQLEPDTLRNCVAAERFQNHMRRLRERFEVRSLEELARALGENRLPARCVAVTLDDGYLDALTTAAPILADVGVPATVFVTSDRLDEEHEYWWDVLERILTSDSTPPHLDLAAAGLSYAAPTASERNRRSVLAQLSMVLRPLSHERRQEIVRMIASWAGADASIVRSTHRVLKADEIVTLARSPGISIGAHTRRHLYLPAHPDALRREEILEDLARLEQVLGAPPASFAYPHGGHDPATVAIVRAAGYQAAVTVAAGVARGGHDPLLLPRIDPRALDGEQLVVTLEQHLAAYERRRPPRDIGVPRVIDSPAP
jgi:peptidoglycan/xylan/chitin deacetylase (PgdA/CDA1 family)